MKRLSLLLALGVLLAPAVPAGAISKNAGTSAAQFLKLGAGARAGAMGEAYSAVADDIYAVYYNPAGLTRLTGSQIAAAHAEHFQDISYEFGAFAYPFARQKDHSKHVLAFAVYNLSVAKLERRTGDTASPTGTFDAGDYSYNLSYAYRANPRLSLGATGKLIHQTIDSYSASAFASDFGLLYDVPGVWGRTLSLAAVYKNIGSDISFAGVSDPLPRGVVFGAGLPVMKGVRTSFDVTKYRDTDVFYGAGIEYTRPFTDNVSGVLRTGINTHRHENDGLNLVTAGAGLSFYRAGFDFAWVPYGDLGNTFRFSLLLKF